MITEFLTGLRIVGPTLFGVIAFIALASISVPVAMLLAFLVFVWVIGRDEIRHKEAMKRIDDEFYKEID